VDTLEAEVVQQEASQDAQVEATEQQEVVQPTMEELQVKLEESQKRIKELESQTKSDTERFTRFKKEQRAIPEIDDLRADIDFLKGAIKIVGKQQSGGFNDSTFETEMSKLESETSKVKQEATVKSKYEEHVIESTNFITAILSEAGFNLEASELQGIKNEWGNAIKQGRNLDGIKAKVAEMAIKRLKGESLKREERKNHMEEKKKSPVYKVDTGTPGGARQDSEMDKLKQMYPTMFPKE